MIKLNSNIFPLSSEEKYQNGRCISNIPVKDPISKNFRAAPREFSRKCENTAKCESISFKKEIVEGEIGTELAKSQTTIIHTMGYQNHELCLQVKSDPGGGNLGGTKHV